MKVDLLNGNAQRPHAGAGAARDVVQARHDVDKPHKRLGAQT